MKIPPEDLQSSKYELLHTIDNKDILTFVRNYLDFSFPLSRFFWFFNLLLTVFLIADLLGTLIRSSFTNTFSIIAYLFLGLGVFFIGLIPLHEAFHAIAYKIIGAPKVLLRVDWNQMAFFALAPNFVVNEREFRIVAVAPFFIITTGLIAGLWLVQGPFKWAIWSALFWHTSGCGGDFALLNFFHQHDDKEVLTFDDAEGKYSYFYSAKKKTQL